MKLITYSPLHIGDGGELIPFEYIKEGDKIKVYPFEYFINKLYETYKDPQALQLKLLQLKEITTTGLRENLNNYFKKTGVVIPPKYEIFTKVDLFVNSRIKTFIKNLEGPYIPGSEIKGALRTVFLYGILKKDPNIKVRLLDEIEKLKKEINELRKILDLKQKKDKKKNILENLQNTIENLENKIFRANQKDGQYDLFKSLIISDSERISYNDLYVDAVRVLNSSRDLRTYTEVLKAGLEIQLNGFIDDKIALEGLKKLSLLNENLKNQNIEKVTWLFLKDSAIDLYLSLIEKEKDFVENKVKDLELKNSLLTQLKKLETAINKVKESSKILIPLRLGQHQGYLSITIMQLIKDEKPELFNEVFKISVQQVRSELNKTRKILEGEKKFLGWCFLYVD